MTRAPFDPWVRAVWAAWNDLPDGCLDPVHTVAAGLHLPPATVAAIVYPPDVFGVWADDQERGA